MLLTDPALLFVVVPILLLGFHAARGWAGPSAALLVLLIGSLFIYAPFGFSCFAILCASLAVNFVVASFISIVDNPRPRGVLFWTGQTWNLLSLLWFKYSLFHDAYWSLWRYGDQPVPFQIPIGISFFTFQQAIMLTDIYRGEPAAVAFLGELRTLRQRGAALVRYGFFVTFFPRLVIGPIMYLREIQPQLASPTFGRLRQRDLFVGLFLIAIGLFKKLAIADNLGLTSDAVFREVAAGGNIAVQSAWLGAVSYYFQLYFDFSGYSDMALGLARLFGFVFPINFYSPLRAVGIVDYYRRWHMTLTRAISRFLFTPLALWGTRIALRRDLSPILAGLLGLWLPLWLNFVVIGIWHGGMGTFVLFGVAHGTWYVAEVELRKTGRWKALRRRAPDRLRRVLGRCLFMVPMVLSLAIFRSESIAAYRHLLRELVTFDPAAAQIVPAFAASAWILVAALIVHALPNAIELLSRYSPGIMTYQNESYGPALHARPSVGWTIVWVALVLGALYFVARQPPFLYMGF